MSDIRILNEMIVEKAIVPLQDGHYGKKEVVLEEKGQYTVTIRHMPEDSEVIVIKGDVFPSLKNVFFRGKKHECKRADFIIVANINEQKFVLYLELKAKSTTSNEADIILQFKGAQCVMAYCREIGKVFWEQTDFLNNCNYRFIKITNIFIDKQKPQFYKQNNQSSTKQGIHDCPEKMLQLSYSDHLKFNDLIK